MDYRNIFDGKAEDYTQSRPGYAPELLDFLYDQCGFCLSSVIADIGSGTGKFAKELLQRGSRVYGVEPGEDMRKTAEVELGHYERFHSVCGDAEYTGLPEKSIDLITVAQAFHWFDPEKFWQECKRILKPGGAVYLIWNTRAKEDPVNQALIRVYSKYCPNFHGFSGGIQQDDPGIRSFFYGKYQKLAFDFPLSYDLKRFIQRSLSSSYSLKPGDTNYGTYLVELKRIFEVYQNSGQLTVGNQSVVYFGEIA